MQLLYLSIFIINGVLKYLAMLDLESDFKLFFGKRLHISFLPPRMQIVRAGC
jgi:hypothetical protein